MRQENRLNSKLQADAAEFLVLGHLLLENIQAYKSYTNHPGYDVIAVEPGENISARIQVKSRWATDAGAIIIRRFDFDFLVIARLNRGRRYTNNPEVQLRTPEYYILSVDEAKTIATKNQTSRLMWSKKNQATLKQHLAKWNKISDFFSNLKSKRA